LIPKTLTILFVILLVGCAAQMPTPSVTPSPTDPPLPSATPSFTATALPPTATLTPSPEPSQLPELTVCSPLEGISLADLPATIFNPFSPPRLGSDDPHHGVDFADIDPVYQIALEGRPVQAIVDGVVAGIVVDRFPYGNAVLVETPLDRLPSEWLAALQIPTPAPLRTEHASLTCPPTNFSLESLPESRSLYLLYAHLKDPVKLNVGQTVTCGNPVGVIGNSGNSLNPHLHIELRVGPSNTQFESISHYNSSASVEEMANYCLWRVSEVFQLLDPMRLLSVEK